MELYLWVHVIVGGLGVILRWFVIAFSDYPRTSTYSKGFDAFLLIEQYQDKKVPFGFNGLGEIELRESNG